MSDTAILKKSFRRLLLGFVFLLNPLFSFVDILPDFIGCIFLFSAFRPLLFLDARIQSARRRVRLFAFLSAARSVLSPVFFSSNVYDGGNTAMLLSFVFAAVSALLELSFVKHLAESFNYLSVRCDSKEALPHLDPAFSLLSIFVFMKNLASALPDLLTLFSPDSTLEYNPGSERAAASFLFAKWAAYVALFVAVFIFAAVVFIRLSRYVKSVCAEEGYLARVLSAAKLAEEGGNRLKLRFDLSGALATLAVLALFSCDYYFDYVSVLPSPLVFVLCFVILYRLREYRAMKTGEIVFCAVGFLASAAAFFYRVFYSQDTLVGVTFYTKPFTVVFGVVQALFVLAAFFAASRVILCVSQREAEIDLSSSRAVAGVCAVVSAALGAYHYVLPKGPGVTDITEAIALFAVIAGIVYVVFAWRMDSAFQKEAEWKFN